MPCPRTPLVAVGMALALGAAPLLAQTQVRIKDLARVQMGQEVPLTGLGLVIGLEGTGDGRRAEFTFQMMSNLMHRMNLAVEPEQMRVRNVAGVSITATLSPYARRGSRLDVEVASLGDASSLQGGTLLQATLAGPDGRTYVVAQGPLSIGGFNLGGGAAGAVRKNHSVVGHVPAGGLVVEEVERLQQLDPKVTLMLYEDDFTTASRMAYAIDSHFGEPGLARAVDPGTVVVDVEPWRAQPGALVEFVAEVEKVRVVPDLPARVVVNEKTGTVIIGENVSVAAVALAHGNLKLKIPSQTGDELFGGGVQVEEEPDRLHPIISSFDVGAMPTVGELVRSFNAVGVTPRDLIAILQALKTAGALRAELVIQ
ncbi:MAG: flagellar basal body P-ring protein FlgI [Candidatus Latescibacterota bacterium]